jgi:hypothetical protein
MHESYRERFPGEPKREPLVGPLDSPQKIVNVRLLKTQTVTVRFTRRLKWTDENPNSR